MRVCLKSPSSNGTFRPQSMSGPLASFCYSLSLSVSQNLQHVAPVEGVCGGRGGGRADRWRNRATLVAVYGLARRNPVAVSDWHHVGG